MTIWWHASKKQQFAAWIYHSLNRVKSVLRKQIVFPTRSTARSLKDFEHEFMVHLKPFLDTGSKLIVCADFIFDLFTGDKDFLNFMTLNLKCEQIGTKKNLWCRITAWFNFHKLPFRKTEVIEAYWTNHKVIYCTFKIWYMSPSILTWGRYFSCSLSHRPICQCHLEWYCFKHMIYIVYIFLMVLLLVDDFHV